MATAIERIPKTEGKGAWARVREVAAKVAANETVRAVTRTVVPIIVAGLVASKSPEHAHAAQGVAEQTMASILPEDGQRQSFGEVAANIAKSKHGSSLLSHGVKVASEKHLGDEGSKLAGKVTGQVLSGNGKEAVNAVAAHFVAKKSGGFPPRTGTPQAGPAFARTHQAAKA